MSTVEKERRVINRAVRVLDEIETRIHELREELEANGDDLDSRSEGPARGRLGSRARGERAACPGPRPQ